MANLLLLHGPNLNLLGTREPDTYGTQDLATINANAKSMAESAGHTLKAVQSNAEHELVNEIQNAPANRIDWIIFNPAAFTHTSVALRDALLAVEVPFIEVHLSNPAGREAFRKHSYFSDIAAAVIAGCGASSYQFAMQSVIERLQSSD